MHAIVEKDQIVSIIIACTRKHIVTLKHCVTTFQNIVTGTLLELN